MSLDLNELQNENERLASSDQGSDFLKNFVRMPEGNGHIVVRFLPPAKAGMFNRQKSPFFQWTRVHRINNRNLHCPKTLQGNRWKGECTVCDYYNHLWRESEKKSPDEATQMQAKARSIKPIERYYYNVLVRSQVDPETQQIEKNVGPLILTVGKTLHKMIIRAIVGDEQLDEPPLGDVTDFTKGRDFKLIKTMRHSGKESYPNYSDSKFLDPSPLGEPDEIEKWLAGAHDLVDLRTVLDADEIKTQLKIHLGLIKEKNDSGFDPSEFQKGASVETTVTQDEVDEYADQKAHAESKKSYVPDETPKSEAQKQAEADDDEVLSDQDFINELQGI